MLAQIKKNDDVKRAYGRMFAYDVPSENSGKSYNANLISYEENQFQWAADSLVAGSIETVMQQELQKYNTDFFAAALEKGCLKILRHH